MKRYTAILSLLLLITVTDNAAARLKSDAAAALKRSAIHFPVVRNDYYSGGLIGNGRLGATVYKQQGDTLCWELGATDVVDHRVNQKYKDVLYTKCRLPIGKILIPMNGLDSDMVMDVHTAEVRGGFGETSWRTYTPAQEEVIVIELSGKGELPPVIFKPALSRSPRSIYEPVNRNMPREYISNPLPMTYKENGYNVCKQPLLEKGEYSTVWKQVEGNGKKYIVIAVRHSLTDNKTERQAIADVDAVVKKGFPKVRRTHIKWWEDFYSKSFVQVNEEKYDNFFWTQLYKLGSATREDKLPIDLMGPWYHDRTPWPAIWWNLNIQLTYSPIFTVNHAELAVPLLDMLDNNVDNLKKNTGPVFSAHSAAIGRASSYDCDRMVGDEPGLLTWTLYYYWQYCKYTGDKERMRDNLFPLLKLAVNHYYDLLITGEDGYMHMPLTFSPEYREAEDCNFELAILRWGCQTLIDLDDQFNINDILKGRWKETMERLTPYPVDGNGFMIGKGVTLEQRHRHYSHLLMIYPLRNFDVDDQANAQLARKSTEYWLGFTGKGAYTGYTYTGASSIYSLLGDGDMAYNNLSRMIDRYLEPNTLYKESGPVFETPMSGLASYTEMLIQGKGDIIKILPAVPNHWQEITFRGLRTENGYEVGAEMKKGKLEKITLKNHSGTTVRVQCEFPLDRIKVKGAEYKIINGLLVLDIPRGRTAEISRL